ncbi:MAG: hypothetical protein DMD73_10645, partial [Gemmatimonadetes bacterium]
MERARAGATAAPSVDEVIGRLGGRALMTRLRAEPDPAQRYPAAVARLRALMDGDASATLSDSIDRLLERVALSTSDGIEVSPDRVNLLTLHSTKGLEFSRVYIVGVEDHQIPGYRESTENRQAEIYRARRPSERILVFLPGAEQAAQQHELAQMVRVVVGEHQRFAQHGLAAAVRDAGEQVGLWVGHEALHGAEVPLHLGHARLPSGRVGRGVLLWPVARRPLRGDVLRALGELDDIPLRDADVLEQAPRSERLPGGPRAPERGRPIADRVSKRDMGVTAAQQLDHVVAKGAVGIGAP